MTFTNTGGALWQRLTDPVEVAVIQTGISHVLHDWLDDQALSSDIDALEYAQHYADAEVKAAYAFAYAHKLIASDAPTIGLKPHCGTYLEHGDIVKFFQNPVYACLAPEYAEWELEYGKALSDEFLAAYAEGGDPALSKALYTAQP